MAKPFARFIRSFVLPALVMLSLPAAAQPTVTALSSVVGLAGTPVTITGTNFNLTPANNVVYFGVKKAVVTAATATSLSVTVPTVTSYAPVSVLNTATGLSGFSTQQFLQTWVSTACAGYSTYLNFDPHFDINANFPSVGPAGIKIADIDGDGLPDIVVGVSNINCGIYVYRNLGAPSGPFTAANFAAPVFLSTPGVNLYIVAVGDIDGDGKLDIACGSQSASNTVVAVRNTSTPGTLSFGAVQSFTSGGALPYALVLADMDNDGKADMVCSNNGFPNFTMFHSTSTIGTISFAAGINYVCGNQSNDIQVLDLDNDGKKDVVVVATSSNEFQIYRNLIAAPGPFVAGSLAAPVNFTGAQGVATSPFACVLGDMDGDGKPDITIGTKTAGVGVVQIFHNSKTTSGAFTAPDFTTVTPFTANAVRVEGMAVGDFDGDGKPDLVVTSQNDSNIQVFRNNYSTIGVPSLATPYVQFVTNRFPTTPSNGNPAFVACADLDGDSITDMAVSMYGHGQIALFRNAPLRCIANHQVCRYDSVLFTEQALGGTWSSSNPAVGSINTTTGMVYGISPGTATISYIVPAGAVTATVTVNDKPSAITGLPNGLNVCLGTLTTLNGVPAGGTWALQNANATVGSATGIVTGIVAPSYDSVFYTIVPGVALCRLGMQLTINPTPLPITGPLTLCANQSTAQLTDASGAGIWTSSNTAVGTVSSTGLVTGLTPGTATIVYSVTPSTCRATPVVVTVNALPGAITGTLSVCQNLCTQLTDATPGGGWTSSDITVATVGSTTGLVCGVVTGAIVPATATITYTIASTGCYTVATVTVNPIPTAISGTLNVCVGSCNPALTDGTPGGTWSSSSTVVGTIGSATGIACGISSGTTTITYKLGAPTSCYTTSVLTVNPLPANITGTLSVCQGLSTQLSSLTGGGTWTSSAVGVATVSATGLVDAVVSGSAGTATTTITYTSALGCSVTAVVTVNPLPTVTSGLPGSLCVGNTATLCATPAGGAWTSSNTTVATVAPGTPGCGVVTAVAFGTSNITYTLPGTGCFNPALAVVTVNPNPNPITGTTSVCAGLTTALTSSPGGGTWTSSNPTNGSVDPATGVVTGLVGSTTVTITYSLGTGCFVTKVVTINPIPSGTTSSSGSFALCATATLTLNASPAGGTWTSGATGVATVVSATGVVTGVTTGVTGTASMTYTLPGTGCVNPTTAVVTVNPNPNPITGPLSVCVGLTTTLNSTTAGGTWALQNITNANLTTASGVSPSVVLGVSGGLDVITYTAASTGCYTVATVTVNSLPTAIGGTFAVCQGICTTLTDGTAGGTWSSSNPLVVTIVSGTGSMCGVVTGATAAVTATITYTAGAGCYMTQTVTVNPLPTSTTASPSLLLCVTGTTTLSATPAGGTWSSSSPGIGSAALATGVVTGVSSGTATITYTLAGTGCYNPSLAVVTVNANPTPITGTLAVCVGLTTTLNSTPAGGTWSLANGNAFLTTGASVSPAIVQGANGSTTDVVTYTASTGCYTVATVTINPNPTSINGVLAVCQGLCSALTDATGGGTWTSSNPAIGSISAAGVACGVSAPGTTNITYTISSTGCYTVAAVTVNALPTAINGTLAVCQGQCTSLTDGTIGGTWSSSNPLIATVTGGGLVCGVNTGATAAATVTITYTLGTGCIITAVVTVNPLPTSTTASPSLLVCVTGTATLSATPGGGTWSSGSGGVASVGSLTGIVTGNSAGTANITYTLSGTGCYNPSLAVVTVNANPTPITGTLAVCVGLSTTLNSTPAGGVWTLANGNATNVGAVITGVNGGASGTTDVVTYSVTATGCYTVATVSINPNPTSINGTLAVCQGLSTALTDGTAGGTWTTSNPAIASAITGTGVVTGNTCANTATITYTLGSTGCYTVATVTVNCNPAAITGGTSICQGQCIPLTDATASGTWTSSNLAVATVSSTGQLCGVNTGATVAATATITYALSTGCITTLVVTVNPNPGPILGNPAVCQGLLTQLSDITPFGTWTSSNPANGSVNTTGGVTGVICATTTSITYTLLTGCIATQTVTINCNPAPITGIFTACVGLCAQLTDATPGGNWTSDNLSIVTIGAGTGLFCGVAGTSTATISYTLPTTCLTTTVVTVNGLPTPINGNLNVCVGACTQLTDATPFGTWSSSNPAVGTVSGSGLVCGVTAGTTVITYTLPTGCIITATVNVNPNPGPINGNLSVCYLLSTTLTDGTGGGTWSVANPFVATIIAGTGVATGQAIAGGTTTVSYILTTTGCFSTAIITVNPLPAPITGPNQVCVNSTISLTDATAGGTWSSSNVFAATTDAIGNVMGMNGLLTATITYTLPTTCIATYPITVNPLPVAVSGNVPVCIGGTITLTDASTGGTWLSGTTTVATVGLGSGVVTGVAPGTSIITYTLPTGCSITTIVTVNPNPGAITGIPMVCVGSCMQLSDPDIGGAWTSSNPAVGTVGATSGVVCGIAVLPPGAPFSITTITYTLGTGCYTTLNVTVYPIPAVPTGTLEICQGTCTTLTDITPGGTWSSSNITNATVGSASGLFCGVLGPTTATISYTLISTGCSNTVTVTVDPLPGVINGNVPVCVNSTITLTDVTAGGAWSSSNTTVGTINSATGLFTGLSSGTTIVSYTLPTNCIMTTIVTVNAVPAPITGPTQVCVGSSISLADPTPGGSWSSTASAVATVGPTGIVTGMPPGGLTTTISYTLPVTGCAATLNITVNPVPAPITGNTGLCLGATSLLGDITAGGVWSSVSTGIATISAGGLVTASSTISGTSTISYTLATGCTATTIVTVSPTPPPITGTFNICTTVCVNLTDLTGGGTWSSSNMGVATVDPLGSACGVTSGTATITYTPPTGCIATQEVTVYPTPAAITPSPLEICQGLTISVSDITVGGTWGSSNPAVAIISPSGVITGIAAGTSLISYTVPSYCYAFEVITVDPLPAAITGNLNVCQGFTTTLSDASTGGNWTSSNPSVASVNSFTGVVTGVTLGTATITFILPTGCIITAVVTVNPMPGNIGGTTSVCVGFTTSLFIGATGGSWSSSVPSVGTVDAAGNVTGISAGTTTITYTTAAGCTATTDVTVFAVPAAITGTFAVCQGLTTALTDVTPGGTWTSSNPADASVGSTGVVTGITGGTTVTIKYSSPGGCFVTAVVTVNPLPGAINGTLVVCQGQTTALTDAVPGGTWSSSPSSVATVGSSTGTVTGGVVSVVSTATITYTLGTGCLVTAIVTVNPLPGPINGTLAVCVASTTLLSDATIGGTWVSSNTAAGTISAGGAVSGIAAGTTTITYTSGLGCFVTAEVTVNPLPAPITGTLTVCQGLTTQLSDITPGGTWTMSNSNATITFITGLVTGITAGTDSAIYTITATGCSVSAIITINPLPATITGTLSVCVGLTTTLSDAGGGTWTSGNPTIATIGSSSGVVTGILQGTALITYTLPTGCIITGVVTVNPNPTAINGSLMLCAGVSSLLADATPGGTWSSSVPSVASIDAVTGIYTGLSGGTTTITYTLPTGCIATTVVTVNPLPGTILGTLAVCEGSTTLLSDATTGGTWYSSIPPLATIGSASGLVTGISAGTVFITYMLPTGCFITSVVTINPVPAPILGNMQVCQGLTTTLSDLTPGGTWVAVGGGNVSVTGAGVVTGINVGTGTVSYVLTATGCMSTAIITVNPNPALITGTLTVCPGLTTQLSDATPLGHWTSSDPTVASVTFTTGLVTGLNPGTSIITYVLPTGCLTAVVVTVNPLPTAILGAPVACVGTTTTLSDATAGGAWSSSNTAVGSIDPVTGVLTGITLGTTTITYTVPATGCYATITATVKAFPNPISGNLNVCVGLTTALSDTLTGGTWSSSVPTVGTIGSASGIATGISAGTSIITYSIAANCEVTAVLTVNPNPTAILGFASVCVGTCTSLSDLTPGGTWSSSDTSVATATLGTGVVCGVSPGVATITYMLNTGCIATVAVTVNPVLAAISGDSTVCVGSTITLSDVSPGGSWSSSNPGVGTISATGVVGGISAGITTISYTIGSGCYQLRTVTVNALPLQFNIFGGGSYCQGGVGKPVSLDGSSVGVSYLLMYDSSGAGFVSATGYIAGTGDTINFGNMTVHGTYTVIATGTTSGCSIGMFGSVNVTITPTINPTVVLTTGVGDSVCPGTSVTLTPIVTSGGSSPSFLWYVNGVAVSTGSTYTFIPADGNVVKVVVTSNATCVFPATATDTLLLRVLPQGVPIVNVTVDPGDTVCQFSTATFTATPTFGGTTPQYIWLVNNTVVGTGHIFTYAPGTGDVVSVKMISSYLCRTTDTAYSNTVTMSVVPLLLPHIDIVPVGGFTVVEDSTIVLRTVVANAGPTPTYQWEVNGIPVPGAVNDSFVSNTLHDNDSVTCLLTSSGFCDGITTFDWVYIHVTPTGVGNVQYVGVSDIRLLPNPNSGSFALKGTLSTVNDEDLSIEITDMLGQIVYRKKTRPDHGKINEQIELSNSIANGMYILNVSSGSDNKSFHFVVER